MLKVGKLTYTRESLDEAVSAVRSGLAKKTAPKKYGVPRATLQFRLKNADCKGDMGPAPILSTAEEKDLVKWICELACKGFPRKKDDVYRSVQEFLRQNPRLNPFTDDRPGDGWYNAFLRRHPIITERTCEGVTGASACVSEDDIRNWFKDLETYFKDRNLLQIFDDPSRIFNGDETNFQLCPISGRVLAPRGYKNVYKIQQGGAKDTLTVMFTFSADGHVTPPMIVYPYQRIPRDVAESIPNGWGVGRSDKGWMKAEVFYEYIANVLHPHLVSTGVTFPVVVFVDGHTTHLTFQLSELCTELQIQLIALYPNATRILQPADVSAFKPIKLGWKNAVHEWKDKHPTDSLNKVAFAPILKTVVDNIKPETVVNGFKACGLRPWNPGAINFSKCLGAKKGTKATDVPQPHGNVDENPTRPNPVIDIQEFREIVGPEMVEKFDRIAEVCADQSGNESFFILYRIWAKLNAKANLMLKGTDTVRQELLPEIPATPELPTANADLPIPHDENEHDNQAEVVNATEQVAPTDSIREEIFQDNFHHNEINNIGLDRAEEENNTEDSNPIEHAVPTENINTETPSNSTNNSSTVVKRVSHSSLGNYLVWPETPKRKGKRENERLPFVITSEKYKVMCKEKEDKKKQAVDEKEERKRKRLEKKELEEKNKKQRKETVKTKRVKKSAPTAKEAPQTNRPKPTTSRQLFTLEINRPTAPQSPQAGPSHISQATVPKIKPSHYGECFKCDKTVKNKTSLVCDHCGRVFHVQCVPRNHKEYIPEEPQEDLFVCHLCFILDSDNESNDLSSDYSS